MKRKIGIEKENLLFTENFDPLKLEYDEIPDFLDIDFANHQLELVTAPNSCSDCAYYQISEIITNPFFKNKIIWPYSYGPKNISEDQIKYNLVNGEYRKYLKEKYGLEKMLISGVHYNYSNELLKTEEQYFNLAKAVYKYLPLIIQFYSFTPVINYEQYGLEKINKDYGYLNSLSLRNSKKYGFNNEVELNLNMDSYQKYLLSVEKSIIENKLSSKREMYTKLRIKNCEGNCYIELRFIDLNPYSLTGISVEQIRLLEIILEYFTQNIDEELDGFNYSESLRELEEVVLKGRDQELILKINGEEKSIKEHTNIFFNKMLSSNYLDTKQKISLTVNLENYNNHKLDCDKLYEDYQQFKSIDVLNWSLIKKNNIYQDLFPESKMELSTKILLHKAMEKGYHVDVESEVDNILKISNKDKSEYVIQATKTNKDTYTNILLMENKFMTKKILLQNNVKTPIGIRVEKDSYLNFDYQQYIGKKIVVKPLDTNFGLGISILKVTEKNNLDIALKNAFEHANSVLIEEFIDGEEMRFLVINHEVVSIVKRVPANVVGNGNKTIQELIEEKNLDPHRGNSYVKPLEKIRIDQDLLNNIKEQNHEINSVLSKDEIVYLRKQSNISTGGDSCEIFDQIPQFYKDVAVCAAKSLGVKICGIDMIIDTNCISKHKYSIIEANFNPAIHIHTYPYQGQGKDVASKILQLLFN